jgi:HEAT repeat protein
MTEETRKQIATLLADPDPDARRGAAEALVSPGNLGVVVPLASALQDNDKGVRDAAFRSLQTIGGINVARAIVEYIGNENIVTRNLASELLIKLGRTATPAIIPYLENESQDVRKFAVDILGAIGGDAPAAAMLAKLDDPDENVVVSAVEALGNMKAAVAVPSLFEAFEHHDFAKAAVAEALGKIGSPAACPFLLRSFQEAVSASPQDPATVFAILEAIGILGSARAWEALHENVGKVSGRLRSALLHALMQIAEREHRSLDFTEPLLPDFLIALKDTDMGIRLSAATAVSPWDQPGVTGALLDAAEDSPEIEGTLTEMLSRRPSILAEAIRYLEDHRGQPAKRTMTLIGKLVADLAKTIMRIDVNQAFERLISRLFILIADRWSTADEEDRALIVDVLFRLDGDNAVEFLDAIMNDPDPWLRMHVIEIIAAIDDPRGPEFIARFLGDDDAMVREVAAGILQSRGFAVDAPEAEV